MILCKVVQEFLWGFVVEILLPELFDNFFAFFRRFKSDPKMCHLSARN